MYTTPSRFDGQIRTKPIVNAEIAEATGRCRHRVMTMMAQRLLQLQLYLPAT